jgi:hypothetical protein
MQISITNNIDTIDNKKEKDLWEKYNCQALKTLCQQFSKLNTLYALLDVIIEE